MIYLWQTDCLLYFVIYTECPEVPKKEDLPPLTSNNCKYEPQKQVDGCDVPPKIMCNNGA